MARVTGRGNIYRRRAQGIPPVWRATAGALVVLAVAVVIFLAETAGKGVPFLSYRTVYVSLPNIGHLQQHDPVEIAGVFVGQIESISTAHNRPLAKLQLQGVGPLPTNTRAAVRGYGLLGARYLEVDPGNAKTMLPGGGTITELDQHGSYTWGIPDALNLFDAKTRSAMQAMWRGFGQGLAGRGEQLNSAIHIGPGSGADFDQAAYAILARPGAAQSFLADQNSGWGALNSAGGDLTAAFSPEATTAQAFIDERPSTEASIAKFPGTLVSLDAGFTQQNATRFWGAVVNLSDTLKPVIPQVPHALDAAVAFLRGTRRPLRGTIPALNEVPRAVPPTLHILSALKPDLAPLEQGLTNLVPPVSNLSEHGCDIQSFATATLGLTTLGTTPGGNWGPDVGFPVGVILQPNGYLNSYLNTGRSPFINNTGYYEPCEFTPGPVIDSSTGLGILNTLLKGAL
jgi:ABC-type transporter Mla subunit MlaD